MASNPTTTKATSQGFTLMEMMVVLAIIALLMILAIPDTSHRDAKLQVNEALKYSEEFKPSIKAYYDSNGKFPDDNNEAGLPSPDKLISTLIAETRIEKGAIHITFGHNAHPLLKGKALSLQPLVVTDSPSSPIDWSCGFSSVPDGMEKAGDNKTNIEVENLPVKCQFIKES